MAFDSLLEQFLNSYVRCPNPITIANIIGDITFLVACFIGQRYLLCSRLMNLRQITAGDPMRVQTMDHSRTGRR